MTTSANVNFAWDTVVVGVGLFPLRPPMKLAARVATKTSPAALQTRTTQCTDFMTAAQSKEVNQSERRRSRNARRRRSGAGRTNPPPF